MKRQILNMTSIAALLSLIALSGCHTVEGAGRDTAAIGSGIAAGAEETRDHSSQRPGPGNSQQQY